MFGPGFSGFGCGPMRGGCCPRDFNEEMNRHSVHREFGRHPFGFGHGEFGHHPFGHHNMFGGHHRHHPFRREFGRHPFDFKRTVCRCEDRRRKCKCSENSRHCHFERYNPDDDCDNTRRTGCQCERKNRQGNENTDLEDEERVPSNAKRIFGRRGGMRGGRCRKTRVTCSRRCGPSENEDIQDCSRDIHVQRIIVENEPRSNSA